MKLRIEGVYPYDGEYEFDETTLTNRDLHTIKTITGHVPPFRDIEDGDQDFVVAFAIIGLRRSGRFPKIDVDLIWDAELGKIIVDVDSEVADPPQSAPETQTTPSGAPGPTDGGSPPVRSLPHIGTDFSASVG